MCVLITGAFGFVGTNLSRFLAQRGQTVWALDVASPATCHDHPRVFTWDALSEIPWQHVDAVVHLAGKAHDTKNTSDAQSYFDINAGLTQKILDACANAAPPPVKRKFILFSSVKAVADQVDGVLRGDHPTAPKTPYGQSKLEAEKHVLVAVQKQPDAIASYVLRPCMIHGPGNKGNLNLLWKMVKRGVPWPLGAFENQRSFASIQNVCAVVEALLTRDVPAGVYQVADDEPLSTNTLVELMANAMRHKPRVWRVPPRLVRALAKTGAVLRLPLNNERLRKLTESYCASNAKIKTALQWQTMPVSAVDGMRATLAGFASHPKERT
jgi:nucleoside-diphosphate-sugar epimerase